MLKNLLNYVKDDDYLIGIYKGKIYIHNYINIISINKNNAKIKLKKGNIIISGDDLFLNKIESSALLLTGTLKEIKIDE